MRVSDFNYNLPKDRIAQFPPAIRGTTRLLVLDRRTGNIEHRHYSGMLDYLKPGDIVVLNNTKVIKARLLAKNAQGQTRELLLLEFHSPKPNHHRHQALYMGTLHEGEELKIGSTTVVVERITGNGTVDISSENDLFKIAETAGSMPLPPYLKREATSSDLKRYQTEFAEKAGSVAAPTASLNFTSSLKSKLELKGVKVVELTLHVGLGTFLPIRVDDLKQHEMHSEYFEMPHKTVAAIQQARQTGNRIIAVGTTVCRTLEFAGAKLFEDKPSSLRGEADIFIYPGYKFKVIDMLLTNFHAPKSTVLMMAAAFAGWPNLKSAYEVAIDSDYKFLSYGDSMLIL
ncbi:MAG TPA: tRNA preQ1(34) S-adenosylmethionine ribosyltransferase-isomerase QueA [Candidatus Binatia bacterium]|nr:tRNA preQ1(34) S-adenosylmethionine ribosyltransferase-isomerase QueA [Candidatus Binatia bacterium]